MVSAQLLCAERKRQQELGVVMDFGGGAGKQAVIRTNSFLNVSGTIFRFAALINKQNF